MAAVIKAIVRSTSASYIKFTDGSEIEIPGSIDNLNQWIDLNCSQLDDHAVSAAAILREHRKTYRGFENLNLMIGKMMESTIKKA